MIPCDLNAEYDLEIQYGSTCRPTCSRKISTS